MDNAEFAYLAAHDLKAPLNGIDSIAGFLLEDYGAILDEDGRTQVSLIRDLAMRGVELVSALKEFALVHNEPFDALSVDLSDLATQAVASARRRAIGATVDADVSALPRVLGDPRRLQQLFDLVVENAVIYNERPRRVLAVGMAVGPSGTPVPAGHVTIRVEDDGIGVPEHERLAVFEMFRRLHGSDGYAGQGGAGAGLALARTIVSRHGGSIWMEPAGARGTRVCFTLPLADPAHEVDR